MARTDSKKLMSRAEVAEIYGISKRYLEETVRNEAGPRLVRIGRLVRYRAADIEAWIEENSTQASPRSSVRRVCK